MRDWFHHHRFAVLNARGLSLSAEVFRPSPPVWNEPVSAPVITMPAIPFDSFFSRHDRAEATEEPLMLLAEAEIILGQDTSTHRVFVVDGKETLAEVLQETDHDPVNVLVVELNQQSDEVRQLRWLIDVAKCRS